MYKDDSKFDEDSSIRQLERLKRKKEQRNQRNNDDPRDRENPNFHKKNDRERKKQLKRQIEMLKSLTTQLDLRALVQSHCADHALMGYETELITKRNDQTVACVIPCQTSEDDMTNVIGVWLVHRGRYIDLIIGSKQEMIDDYGAWGTIQGVKQAYRTRYDAQDEQALRGMIEDHLAKLVTKS